MQSPGMHNPVATPDQERTRLLAMNAAVSPLVSPDSAGWKASLELGFAVRGDRTVLVHKQHCGPLRVQRPFYPESAGQAHVYILHPPGGVVAGDELRIRVDVAAGAHALITTPSAGRVYRSNAARLPQSQHNRITVEDGGWGEWLPQENIVFNDAQARNSTQVDIAGSGRFIGWEIVCLGRPASQQWFEQGELLQSFALYRDGAPLLLERSRFVGGSALLQAHWGMQGFTTAGTLVCTDDDTALLQQLKTLCAVLQSSHGSDVLRIAVTRLPGLLVVRGLANNAAPLRNGFIACWHAMRLHLRQQPAVAPRIWFT